MVRCKPFPAAAALLLAIGLLLLIANAAVAQGTASGPDALEWRLEVSPEVEERPGSGENQRTVNLYFQVSCRADGNAAWQSPPDCGGWSDNPAEPSDLVWIEVDPGWGDNIPADQAVKGQNDDFGSANFWGQPGGDAKVINGKRASAASASSPTAPPSSPSASTSAQATTP